LEADDAITMEGLMTMKIGVLATAALFAFGVTAFAESELTGVLVDKGCYTKDKANTGLAHSGADGGATCAQDCAKKGSPVAIVTDKGEVYEVTPVGPLAGENNTLLVPHMSHTVTLLGDVVTADDGTKVIRAAELKMVKR
jgi:hypothetical protein